MDARRSITTLLALSLAVAACTAVEKEAAAPPAVAPADVAAEAAAADDHASAPVDRALDADVHYAGFLLHLDRVQVSDGLVSVSGTAENLGATTSVPPSAVTLASGAAEVELDALSSGLDDVPGESTGTVTYGFRIDGDFDVEDAVLQIGGPGFARALVPLDGGGGLVDNRPVVVAVTGDVVADETTFTLHGAEVRFDVPEDHSAAEAGTAFLTVSFSLTNSSSFAGGYAFGGQDLRLETPAGMALAPEDFPIELLAPNATAPNLSARWVIDLEESGTYTFVGLRNVGFDSEAEGRLSFVVPPVG